MAAARACRSLGRPIVGEGQAAWDVDLVRAGRGRVVLRTRMGCWKSRDLLARDRVMCRDQLPAVPPTELDLCA